MISAHDVVWLAGYIEGEGHFTFGQAKAILNAKSIDRDVILRVARLFGTRLMGPFQNKDAKPTWQPWFLASCAGAVAIGWMMTLYPFLGVRRKARIRTILAQWQSLSPRPSLVWSNCAKRRKSLDGYSIG